LVRVFVLGHPCRALTLFPLDQPSINESLDGLRKELEHRSRKQPLDGYLNYLLGLVYKEQVLFWLQHMLLHQMTA
jgi:hypothetical protein